MIKFSSCLSFFGNKNPYTPGATQPLDSAAPKSRSRYGRCELLKASRPQVLVLKDFKEAEVEDMDEEKILFDIVDVLFCVFGVFFVFLVFLLMFLIFFVNDS